MVEEVKGLLDRGVSPDFLDRLGLEYRYTTWYLQGRFATFSDYREKLLTEIRRFAKRQQTWFRRDADIVWLDTAGDYTARAISLTEAFLAHNV